MNAVDTIHEFAGFSLAGMLHAIFAGVGLPLIVALGGTAWLAHRMADRGGTPKELALHLLSLVLMWGLLSTTAVDTVRAPRLAVWTSHAADLLQKRAAKALNERFLEDPYGWERLAAMAAHGRIFNVTLATDVELFLESCATPALAQESPQTSNLLRPGALRYSERCEEWRGRLWDRVEQHLREDPRHQGVFELARRREGGDASFFERYADLVVTRAIDEPGSPTSESALVLASLGTYRYFDQSQSVGGGGPHVWDWIGSGIDAGVSVLAELRQGYANRFAAKQAYFTALAYGPHLYGLALLLTIGFFPVASLWALLPGRWGALVNWGKVLVSVKLWPVGWAALSVFNVKRGALEALAPPERGTTDLFLGVAAMYLLVPAFAFAAVQAASAAAALPFSGGLPPAAGAPSLPGLRLMK